MGGRRPAPPRRRGSIDDGGLPSEDELSFGEGEDDSYSDSDSNTDGFSFLGASGPAHPPGQMRGSRMGRSMSGAYERSSSFDRHGRSSSHDRHGRGPFHAIVAEVLQTTRCPYNSGDSDHSSSANCEGNMIDEVLSWVDHFGYHGPAEPRAIHSFLEPHIHGIRMNMVETLRDLGIDVRDFEDVKRIWEERQGPRGGLYHGGGGGRHGGYGGHGGGGRHGRYGGGGRRRQGGHGMGYGY